MSPSARRVIATEKREQRRLGVPEVTRLDAALDDAVLGGLLDAVGGGFRPRRDHLAQGLAVEDKRNAVVGGPAVAPFAGRDELPVRGPPSFLAVVVRAAAPRQQSQAVVQRREPREPE
jgi:hypothetical protein